MWQSDTSMPSTDSASFLTNRICIYLRRWLRRLRSVAVAIETVRFPRDSPSDGAGASANVRVTGSTMSSSRHT